MYVNKYIYIYIHTCMSVINHVVNQSWLRTPSALKPNRTLPGQNPRSPEEAPRQRARCCPQLRPQGHGFRVYEGFSLGFRAVESNTDVEEVFCSIPLQSLYDHTIFAASYLKPLF